MAARQPQFDVICRNGEDLIANKHQDSRELRKRIQNLSDRWQKLRDLAKQRKTRLEDASESHQYYADANEAEAWMKEKLPLVQSDDYGKDEATAKVRTHGCSSTSTCTCSYTATGGCRTGAAWRVNVMSFVHLSQ